MGEASRGERLQIMLNEDELRALDDWRFSRRMPSRASAIRELLRRGLAAEGAQIAGSNAKSTDFGVIIVTPEARLDGDGTKSGS
jgi:metal-responsive CopG/Arc/MetJ family transcriptional regulator